MLFFFLSQNDILYIIRINGKKYKNILDLMGVN